MGVERYDAIVVGARCAGSPTAMLLARKGYRVLLVDRATFPADTMSTHVVHPPGVAALRDLGPAGAAGGDRVPAPWRTYSFDFGPLTISGTPQPIDGIAHGDRPAARSSTNFSSRRRSKRVQSCAKASTSTRSSLPTVRSSGIQGHAKAGATVTERARMVIGADGRHSLMAKTVQPEHYDERCSHLAMYYAYWSGLPADGFDTTIRAEHRRGWAAIRTHDDLTVVPFGWPVEEFHANRSDIEANFLAAVQLAPEFAERVRAATRESKFIGSAE